MIVNSSFNIIIAFYCTVIHMLHMLIIRLPLLNSLLTITLNCIINVEHVIIEPSKIIPSPLLKYFIYQCAKTDQIVAFFGNF